MLLSDFLTLVTRGTYLLIAAITLSNFVAHRDRTRLDIALMFLTLGVTVLFQVLALVGLRGEWVSQIAGIIFLAQPYMLIRLVGHFQPLPRWVYRLALLGMVLSWVLLLALPNPLPAWAVLPVILYLGGGNGYAAVAFVRGARQTGGVSHWRYLLAATGSGLLAILILLAGVFTLVPAMQAAAEPITQTMTVASGLAFYFGFAPPRWLRRTWQLDELHRFLRATAGQPASVRASQIMVVLCETGQRAVGGTAALAAALDEASQQLTIRASTRAEFSSGVLAPSADGAIGRAWLQRQAAVAGRPSEMSAEGRRLAQMVGAEALLAVPVQSADKVWGVLVVLLQRSPLFPQDDLELLGLFGEQAAMALEQLALVQEQQGLLTHLQERTAQLEAANRELEAFSYSVSHDLRAPLRHIEGFTDLLLRDAVPPERQRTHLQRISEAAVRMGHLIDDLLSFSRMGRAELHVKGVALGPLVDDVRRELQAETEGRDITWTLRPLPEVVADAELLRLALYNLLANAVKYTRGRPQSCIEVGAENNGSDEVVLYVKDNGVGFDMRYVDKLFGVFQRLHHSDEFEGIGIGLANVRRIVHRHGGRTWAVGAPDQGATFYVALPMRPAATGGRAPAPAAGLDRAATRIGGDHS